MLINATDKCKKLILESAMNLSNIIADNSLNQHNCEALIESTEKLALCARSLTGYCLTQKECDNAKKSIGRAMDIKIEATPEGWIKVSLPMLHHRKFESSAEFIREPLRRSLVNFFSNYENLWHKRFYIKNGVIAVAFCYPNDKKSTDCYDIDNINEREYKGIIDDISLFTLPDDGPFYCARYLTAKQSEKEHTEVYVLSKKEFVKWYEKYVLIHQ